MTNYYLVNTGSFYKRQLLPHRLQILQAPVHAFQRRVGITFLLHHAPLCVTNCLAQVEDFFPRHVAFADEGFVVGGGMFLKVHR